MDINKDIIGIVGGMGSYATLNIFKRILDAFDAEKEWERPHIVIDNVCTLPSRTRAILYNEKYDEVLDGICQSIKNLMYCKANIIILSSNTCHLFLNEIYKKIPEAKKYIVNFIELLAMQIKREKVDEVLLLGTEATVDFNIYANYLNGVKVVTPNEEKVKIINHYIEVVKQNKINEKEIEGFKNLINDFSNKVIILGCTELPVLYELFKEEINKSIYDPINAVIEYIKEK